MRIFTIFFDISKGSITSAYGSAMVKIGNTSVAAGVQAELSLLDENLSSQLSSFFFLLIQLLIIFSVILNFINYLFYVYLLNFN